MIVVPQKPSKKASDAGARPSRTRRENPTWKLPQKPAKQYVGYELDLPIIDAHVHYWDPRCTPRAVSPLVRTLGFSPGFVDWVAKWVFPRNALDFFARPTHITRAYLPADFAADCGPHQVRGVVHVEASWQGNGPLGSVDETRWLHKLNTQDAGRILGIVAHADLSLGEAVGEVLDAHLAASDRVRGVRDVFFWHANSRVLSSASAADLFHDPRWRAGFEQLSSRGLRFETPVFDSQLEGFAKLARAYPEQPIILCHLGTPVAVGGPFVGIGQTQPERAGILSRWEDGMRQLAECPNVVVKLSGLTMPVCGFGFERRKTPPSAIELADALSPLLRFAIETFGVQRCMFASNFPIDKVSVPYPLLFDAYAASVADFAVGDRMALFHDTAARVYGVAGPVA